MRTKLVIAAVVAAATVSAVGASAYTESITGGQASKVVGYTATTISGANMHAYPVLHYSAGYDQVTGIDVVLDGDTTASTLYLARNNTGAAACSDAHGTHDAVANTTTYTCTGLTYAVAGMTSIGYALQ